jgi:pimeloyl-ACP methyl ester carboxylesterase
VKAAWIPVAIVCVVLAAGCGGRSYPKHATVAGPMVEGADPAAGVWLFRPTGKPKRVVIFFHGQGGPEEATPVNHRPWIDHLVSEGNAVIYPRYEESFARRVLEPAVAGVRTAAKKLDEPDLPVLVMGYSRGGGLAVEYAAVADSQNAPIPRAVETINAVPAGDQSRIVDLGPLKHDTVVSVIVSDKDGLGGDGSRALLRRLQNAGFPGKQIQLHFARSTKTFLADHIGPMRTSPEARKAYWAPTDALLRKLGA